jgi:magnesium transporter
MPASSKTRNRLAYRLLREYPLEAARTLEKSRVEDVVSFLSNADISEISEVLRFMNKDLAAACLPLWPAQRVTELISAMPPQVSSRLLRSLDPEAQTEVFNACEERAAIPVRRLLKYPENTAGACMDPNPPALPSDVNVSAARSYLEKTGSSQAYYLYITDRKGALIGVCGIRDLFQSPPGSPLHQVMQKPVTIIPASANRRSIIAHPGWQAYHSLPVVGNNSVLVGVINYRTLREIERENSAQNDEVPLFIAIGEMYWLTFLHLTEGLMRLIQSENKRKDGRA